jgi:hypothetical protein
MVWSHLDLVSKRLFKKDLPVGLVVGVDALGFLSFLALLVANGIIASNMGSWQTAGDSILLTYTSVPWMFGWYVGMVAFSYRWGWTLTTGSSAIHGFIFLQNGSKLMQSRGCSVCPSCRRSLATTPVPGTAHAKYSRVVSEYDPDDVEATPTSGSESAEECQPTPAMRESMDIPDESACLIVQEP